jgi:hypothetical protein
VKGVSVADVEVRIGVVESQKELSIEIDSSADEISKSVSDALQQDGGILWLTDVKGRRVGVPANRLAYVELETDGGGKHVGFGS